jgi:hypothetical protein
MAVGKLILAFTVWKKYLILNRRWERGNHE